MVPAFSHNMLHLTAKTRHGELPYAYLWSTLRQNFPDTLACCLMPNHLHLLVEEETDPVIRLWALLNNDGNGRGKWGPIPEPAHFSAPQKIRRQLRYVLLNPCRARLCSHPLQWRWSTHRGLVGGVVDPWTPWERVRIQCDTRDLNWLHRYITADPSVEVEGTALPLPPGAEAIATQALNRVLRAAWLANSGRPIARFRSTAVALAHHQGWTNTPLLAHALHISPQHVRRLAKTPSPRALAAARLVLGDENLLWPQPQCSSDEHFWRTGGSVGAKGSLREHPPQ
jgi:hypothetical protein